MTTLCGTKTVCAAVPCALMPPNPRALHTVATHVHQLHTTTAAPFMPTVYDMPPLQFAPCMQPTR